MECSQIADMIVELEKKNKELQLEIEDLQKAVDE
jgi:hypothetical protein